MLESEQIGPNLEKVHFEGRDFYLLGTAHVSKASVELVRDTISELKPDTVCVELCEPRFTSLTDPHRWRQMDLFKVIREGKAYFLMAQLALAGFQKKIGDQLDVKPGDEMRAAIDAAKEHGANLELIDREVKTTLRRAWSGSRMRSLFRLFSSLVGSLFSKTEISAEDIENLKGQGGLNDILTEFTRYFPDFRETLINERDRFMATKLLDVPGQRVLAILGAAHVPGVKEVFGTRADLDELNEIPPPTKLFLGIAWGIPLFVLGLITYGFLTAGLDTSAKMIEAWVIANGLCAFIGALIALPHPLTALAAFVAAPFTSLNPTIGAGWVCGAVQAIVDKPRVKDLETIGDDIATLKGLWGNRVSKVLLVMAFANAGSAIGTLIGIGKIATLLQ